MKLVEVLSGMVDFFERPASGAAGSACPAANKLPNAPNLEQLFKEPVESGELTASLAYIARARRQLSRCGALSDAERELLARAEQTFCENLYSIDVQALATGLDALRDCRSPQLARTLDRVCEAVPARIEEFQGEERAKALVTIGWVLGHERRHNANFFNAAAYFVKEYLADFKPSWLVNLAFAAHEVGHRSEVFCAALGTLKVSEIDGLEAAERGRLRTVLAGRRGPEFLTTLRSNRSLAGKSASDTLAEGRSLGQILKDAQRDAHLGVADCAYYESVADAIKGTIASNPHARLTAEQVVRAADTFATRGEDDPALWRIIVSQAELQKDKLSLSNSIELLESLLAAGQKATFFLEYFAPRFIAAQEVIQGEYPRIAHIYGEALHYHEGLLSHIQSTMLKETDRFTSSEHVELLWSMAKLNEFNPELATHASNLFRSKIYSLSLMDCSRLSWCSVFMGGDLGTQMWQAVEDRFASLPSHIRPSDLIRHNQAGIALGTIDPEQGLRRIQACLSHRKFRPSELNEFEQSVCESLRQFDYEPRTKELVAGFETDILIGRCVIECDGDRFHRVAGTGKSSGRDYVKRLALARLRYRVVSISGDDWLAVASDPLPFLSGILKGA